MAVQEPTQVDGVYTYTSTNAFAWIYVIDKTVFQQSSGCFTAGGTTTAMYKLFINEDLTDEGKTALQNASLDYILTP